MAQLLENGKIEFGLQRSGDGGETRGDRILPPRRFFPTRASVLRRLGSSYITVDS